MQQWQYVILTINKWDQAIYLIVKTEHIFSAEN